MSTNQENIKPALCNPEKPSDMPTEMSDEEFRRTLYSWFEDRGMIAELRAHLRRQMITYLKDTSLGQAVHRTQTALSPKTQIMNLLIAEFLLKNKYHYSLSVFSSEVPFISVFPDITTSLMNYSNTNKEKKNLSFTQQNFWDILQALGFTLKTVECQKLYDMYFNNSESSLLSCMIILLANLCSEPNDIEKLALPFEDELHGETNNCEPWIKDIHNLLLHYNVNTNRINDLRNHLKKIVEREQNRVRAEESTKYNAMKAQLENNIKLTESDIYKTLGEMEKTFFLEKQKMTDEMFEYEKEIESLKMKLREQQIENDQNKELLKRREENLKRRELEMDEHSKLLESRMKSVQNLYDAVLEENARKKRAPSTQSVQSTQSAQSAQSTQTAQSAQSAQTVQPQNDAQLNNDNYKLLKKEFESMRNEIQETKDSIKSISLARPDSRERAEDVEQKLLSGMIDNLERQNLDLRALNQEQQRRLEELMSRNAQLMSDLQNTQTTISLLAQQRPAGAVTAPPLLPPPSPPPPMPERPRRSDNSLSGGGENLGFAPHPPTPSPSQRLVYSQPTRDQRRKVPKRLVIHGGAEDTSSSPTEEVLHEARRRLRRLEEETEQVDRNYRAFRERQARAVQQSMRYFAQRRAGRQEPAQPGRRTAAGGPQPQPPPQPAASRGRVHESTGAKSKRDQDEAARDRCRLSADQSTNSSGLFDVLPPIRSLSLSSIDVSSDSDNSDK